MSTPPIPRGALGALRRAAPRLIDPWRESAFPEARAPNGTTLKGLMAFAGGAASWGHVADSAGFANRKSAQVAVGRLMLRARREIEAGASPDAVAATVGVPVDVLQAALARPAFRKDYGDYAALNSGITQGLDAGLSRAGIGETLGVPKSSVQRAIQRMTKPGHKTKTLAGIGALGALSSARYYDFREAA